MKYLIVTHIPFQVVPGTQNIVIDGLWERDLAGLVASIGPISVAAPEIPQTGTMQTWGPTSVTVGPDFGVRFVGFPPLGSRLDFWKWPLTWRILKREVAAADLIHTSNFFPPYLGLSYAHREAVKLGKKTLFVIAEDFYDMLEWEWVRTSSSPAQYQSRLRTLKKLERLVGETAATASLTFLHTPAAVQRFRNVTQNGIAIRQPGHETDEVISLEQLEAKCRLLRQGAPLHLIAACRHKALKGLDFLIRAMSLLEQTGVRVEATLYGQGEDTEKLKALAAALGIAEQVRFPGALPPGKAIYAAIQTGHLFAMPHRTTDFGRAFFDAMAGGTPVLAFRTPASIDTVRDQIDGFLAPLDDVEGLAAAIRYCHEHREKLIAASHEARHRALINTRSLWFKLRTEWVKQIL
ncbi:MAG: glycosyltransferase [Blastocatellia bacterium]|nr:glycosyltransferase [Blastocatellia bacterium]